MSDYTGSFSGSFTGSFNGIYEGVSSQVQYTLINGIPVTITPFQKNSIIANNNFRQNVFPQFSSSVESRITDNNSDRLLLSSSLSNRITENSSSIITLSSSTNILSSSLSNRITENSSSIVSVSSSLSYLQSTKKEFHRLGGGRFYVGGGDDNETYLGDYSLYIGDEAALYLSSSAFYKVNTFVGYAAGRDFAGEYGTAFGAGAGRNVKTYSGQIQINTNDITFGGSGGGTYLGVNAGRNVYSSNNSQFIGSFSGMGIKHAFRSTFIGDLVANNSATIFDGRPLWGPNEISIIRSVGIGSYNFGYIPQTSNKTIIDSIAIGFESAIYAAVTKSIVIGTYGAFNTSGVNGENIIHIGHNSVINPATLVSSPISYPNRNISNIIIIGNDIQPTQENTIYFPVSYTMGIGTHTPDVNYKLDVSGSVYIEGNTVVDGIISSSFEGNGSLLTNIDADNTELQQAITSNQTVGGISAGESFSIGTSVEEMLRQILIQYIPPTIGNISLVNNTSTVLSSNTTYQVGNSITFNNVDIQTTSDDPNLRYPFSASFTASGASTGDFELYLGDYTLGPDSSTVQQTKTERVSLISDRTINVSNIPSANSQLVNFYVNGVNPDNGLSISSNIRRITYVYPIYYGMSAIDYSVSGDIHSDGDITTLIQTKDNKTLPINGTLSYIYFAYPSRYGVLSDIKDGNGFTVSGFLGNRYTRTINGSGWSSVEYYIYRSVEPTTVNPSQNYQFIF